MYELARNPEAQSPGKERGLATASEVDRLTSVFLESLHVSGYVKPRVASSTEEKIRRLWRRLHVSSDDAEILLGMLRKILWKLRATSEK
jgi:tRNA/rRNA methyltransferase